MNFKPMYDRVLVRQVEAETRTASGFIIPDAIQEQPNQATVLATGPGRLNKDGVTIPMTVKVEDKVMFAPGAGIKVKVDGEEYLILVEEEIIAVVG